MTSNSPKYQLNSKFWEFFFLNSRELDDIWEYLTMRPLNNRKNELNKSSTLQILKNACIESHADYPRSPESIEIYGS